MKYVRRTLTFGCVYMTVISLIFFGVAALINSAEQSFDKVAISFSQYLLILLFSFLIAVLGCVFMIERIHFLLRILIHYAVLLTGFIVIFAVAGNLRLDSSAKIFVAIFLFTLLYAAVMAAWICLGRSLIKKTKRQASANQPYRSMFR